MKFIDETLELTTKLLNGEMSYEYLHKYYAIANVLKEKTVLDIACGEPY